MTTESTPLAGETGPVPLAEMTSVSGLESADHAASAGVASQIFSFGSDQPSVAPPPPPPAHLAARAPSPVPVMVPSAPPQSQPAGGVATAVRTPIPVPEVDLPPPPPPGPITPDFFTTSRPSRRRHRRNR